VVKFAAPQQALQKYDDLIRIFNLCYVDKHNNYMGSTMVIS